MREIDALQYQLGQTAEAVSGRIRQLQEALHHLAGVTVTLVDDVPVHDGAVEAWLEQSDFVRDPDGYFERREVLQRARSGDIDPDVALYYAHHRYQGDPEALRRMFALRDMGPRLRAVRERLGDVEWLYYQDARGWAMSYPMHDPTPVIPADFDWLGYLTYQSVEPGNNPQRALRWTPPNVDYGGTGIMVACSVPLYSRDGGFFGVWSVDVPVRSLLHDAVVDTIVEGQVNFIVDADGFLVAHELLEKVISGEKGAWVRQPMTSLGPGFEGLDLAELHAAGTARLDLEGSDGERRVVLVRSLPEMGWLLFVTFPAAGVLDAVERSFQEAFSRLRRGDASYRIEEHVADEVQGLVDGYNHMAAELQQTLAQQEALRAEAERTRQLQVVGQLAGGIAHDFNNLLTVIMSSASLLRQSIDEEQADLVQGIATASETAGALTRQLLSLSRGELVQPRQVRVEGVMSQAARLLRHLCPSTVTVRWVAPGSPATVFVDPTQLLQVVLNLGINARDAVQGAGCIELQLRETPEHVVVAVVDDGIGMSEATQARVFEAFFTTRATGTGLGLATVRRIVDEAGGEVHITSRPGEGSPCAVELPRGGSRVVAATTPRSLRGLSVWVVDDEPMVRRFTRRVLESVGCQVRRCASSAEVLDLLATEVDLDVLLTDVVMPGLGGRQLAEEVLRRRPGTPVLYMSGYSDDEMLHRGVRSADVALLPKPFTAEQLVAAVRQATAAEATRASA